MRAEIAIVGAGYVGVPLARTFADAGKRVLLVDVDPTANIEGAQIQDEPWMFGNEDSGESTLAV